MIRHFLRNWSQVGAIAPTSRHAQEVLLSPIDFSTVRHMVELGSGQGNITRTILEKLQPDARLLAIEIDPEMADQVRRGLPDARLTVLCASAADLPRLLQEQGWPSADAICSTIPFTSLPDGLRQDIMRGALGGLRPDGVFVAIQYTPLVMPRLMRSYFNAHRVLFAPFNLPPALVYAARKV